MWYVVEFRKMANSKLKSVCEVPSNWVDLKKMSCRWPDYASAPCELSNLISNKVSPNDKFGTYGIRNVMCSTDVYSKAVEFAKRATKTADLETSDSEVEVFQGSKRIKITSSFAQAKKSVAHKSATEPPKVAALPKKSPEAKLAQKSTPSQFRPLSLVRLNQRSSIEPLKEIENVPMRESLELSNSDNPWLVIEQVLVTLISSIEATRVDVKELKKDLARQDAKIDWIRHNMSTENSVSELPILSEIESLLPISNEESLSSLELELETKSSLIALIRRLALVGGLDVRKAACRTMAKVMADEFAQKFNYRGKGEKMAFSILHLNKAVIRSVRRSFPKSGDTEIESGIKDWLKNAPTRIQRRKAAKRSGAVLDDPELQITSETDEESINVFDIPSLD